jgi:LssY C-terminus
MGEFRGVLWGSRKRKARAGTRAQIVSYWGKRAPASLQTARCELGAGWHPADPLTLETSLRIVTSTVCHRPYVGAPANNLYLSGRKGDQAFEQPVDGNTTTRRAFQQAYRPSNHSRLRVKTGKTGERSSANESTIKSAMSNCSRATELVTARQRMPARLAASTPAGASSIARHSAGGTPRR